MEQRNTEPANNMAPPAGHQAKPAKRAELFAIIVLAILIVAGGFALVRRFTERGALAKETERLAIPTVGVIKASAEPAADELVLPAQLQAYVESAIFARKKEMQRRNKDIGSKVKKGELLAEIDTPEVDQDSTGQSCPAADCGAIDVGQIHR